MALNCSDLAILLQELPAPRQYHIEAALQRQLELTKPPGALGRLEDLAVFLAGWSNDGVPRSEVAHVAIFAGNHGVAARGVSPFPADVTAQMVGNFANGGAAINALARAHGMSLAVHTLDLDIPTEDFTQAAAMSEADTLRAFEIGLQAVPAGLDVVIIGEMGIANTTVAAALAARVFGGTGADWVGPGTGHSVEGVKLKAQVVDSALARHNDTPRTTFDTLRTLGGRELAAMAGALIAARRARIPVLLDGFVVSAALAALTLDAPTIVDHCIAAHVSGEPAHRRMLELLKLQPLLDLGLRLGEGTGAAAAMPLLRAAVATHTGMATFAEAAVSNRRG